MIIVGEKINGTLDDVREALLARDERFVADLAVTQAESGADYIDVNVGTGTAEDESELMSWAVDVVMAATEKRVCLDSSDPDVLEAGMEICKERIPLINSVTGESERLDRVLALVANYSCPVVALAMDDSGIPGTAEGRLEICQKIVAEATGRGIDAGTVFFDPLVLPISADCEQARLTLDTLTLVQREIPGAKTILGLSNVSFGLPGRTLVNAAMVTVATYLGLDAVLMDPTEEELRAAVYAAEAVAGDDRYCKGFMKAFRGGLIS
jgi:cobalamin-dependent methionine synthase I